MRIDFFLKKISFETKITEQEQIQESNNIIIKKLIQKKHQK